MKNIDRLFFWSIFSCITLFLIIKEFINDFPEIVSFMLIIIASISFGYALVVYPLILYFQDDANGGKHETS